MALTRVALDAMGGDHGPAEVLAGATLALAADPNLAITLVGTEAALAGAARDRLDTVVATEILEMDDHAATSARRKKDSSIRVAARLVAEGRADAVVSAGNSGGIMAAAIFELKRFPGLERPAIGALVPSRTGNTFLLDVGANADVRPVYLQQFAALGEAYARRMMGIARPRVGLLSNGEEEGKGSALVIESYDLIKALPINFVGNVEGKALFSGEVDVVVTDGFTGNIALKSIEGVAEYLFSAIRTAAKSNPVAMAGGLLLRPSLGGLREKADWRKVGGALLLGVNGACIIAHGRSDAEAAKNAVLRGAEAHRRGVVDAMRGALTQTE